MSRGLGQLQQEILDRVRTDGPVSLNQLCWKMAEVMGQVSKVTKRPFPEGGIEKSFYKSFRRAVTSLEDRQALQLSLRPAETLQDLAELYPYRTQDLWVRSLRESLLPWTVDFLLNQSAPEFGVTANEHFLLERLPREKRQQLASEWGPLWNELTVLLGQVPAERRASMFSVMVKGEELFQRADCRCSSSFDSLLKSARNETTLSPQETDLYERIYRMYVGGFPRQQLKSTRIKSRIYAIAAMGKDVKQPFLKDEFKEALLKAHQGLIESMPGHKSLTEQKDEWLRTRKKEEPGPSEEERKRDEKWGIASHEEQREGLASELFCRLNSTKYSHLLDKLILRDVFRPFEFAMAAT
jgi:hypothetical protein